MTYSGDSVYGPSTGTISLTINVVSSSTGTFTVSAPSLTVAAGNSGSTAVTVTPAGGYTGNVSWALSANPTLSNACYSISNVAVAGTTSVTTATVCR